MDSPHHKNATHLGLGEAANRMAAKWSTKPDWKFFITLILTVASVGIPVLLWQLELTSKALTLTSKSVAEIQPRGIGPLDGIHVSVDGKPLTTPFVSVIELTNSGSKPIVAADFEGPLKIMAAQPAVVVKVQLASTTPASLEPTVALVDGVVLVHPLLLNPNDKLRLTLITANARPQYSARGRIAGVSEIGVTDAQSGRATKRYWAAQIAATLLIAIYIFNMSEFAHAAIRRRLPLPGRLITGVVACLGGALLLVDQNSENTAMSMLPNLVVAALLSLPVVISRLKRELRRSPSTR